MTAFHNMMLFSPGAPETPAGGSSCSLLKSLISRLLAAVDMMGKYADAFSKLLRHETKRKMSIHLMLKLSRLYSIRQ